MSPNGPMNPCLSSRKFRVVDSSVPIHDLVIAVRYILMTALSTYCLIVSPVLKIVQISFLLEDLSFGPNQHECNLHLDRSVSDGSLPSLQRTFRGRGLKPGMWRFSLPLMWSFLWLSDRLHSS